MTVFGHAVMEGVNADGWADRKKPTIVEEWMDGDRESTYLAIDATANPPQEGPYWNLHLPYTATHGNMTNTAACKIFEEAQQYVRTQLPLRHVPIKANGFAPAILRGMAWGVQRGVRVFSSSHQFIDRQDPDLVGITTFCLRNDVIFVTSRHDAETDTGGHHVIKAGHREPDNAPGVEFVREDRTASHAIAVFGAKLAAAWCLVPSLTVDELFERVIEAAVTPMPDFPRVQYGDLDLRKAMRLARSLKL